jgi:signal transduction histidine kinase
MAGSRVSISAGAATTALVLLVVVCSQLALQPTALSPGLDARELPRSDAGEHRLVAETVLHFQDTTVGARGLPVPVGVAMGLTVSALMGTLWLERRRRHAAEIEVRRHLATMADLDRRAAMGHLTASLAHQLRQPLGAILRNSEAATAILESDIPDLSELQEIVEDIRKDDKRAAEIIRRVKTLLQNHEVHEEPVNLAHLVQETVQFMTPDASAKSASIQVASQASVLVTADYVHLQQVLVNLIINGLDAMAQTPPDHRVILVSTIERGSTAEISVRDQGVGISPGSLKRVFDPFFSTKADSMGMGLSVARNIVEAHRGQIVADNNIGRGATIRVLLPVRQRAMGTGDRYADSQRA